LASCADADIPELTRLARTLDSWRGELLAYFDTGGLSNGPTEAINLLIKKIKRVGHGFRNFDNYLGPTCHDSISSEDRASEHAGGLQHWPPSGDGRLPGEVADFLWAGRLL